MAEKSLVVVFAGERNATQSCLTKVQKVVSIFKNRLT